MKQYIYIIACNLLLFTACQKKEKEIQENKEETIVKSQNLIDTTHGEMCFRQIVSKDTMLLTMKKDGDNVSGTYKSIPYEKDKRTIIFNGTINNNTITSTGTAIGEGQTQKEEFIFTLENNQAGIKFGEMIEGDDGVYRYKNKNNTTSLFLDKVECQ